MYQMSAPKIQNIRNCNPPNDSWPTKEATGALQIEVAQSVDSESCLAKVTRFIVWIGYTSIIIMDNGTNFAGAARELKSIRGRMDQS